MAYSRQPASVVKRDETASLTQVVRFTCSITNNLEEANDLVRWHWPCCVVFRKFQTIPDVVYCFPAKSLGGLEIAGQVSHLGVDL